jgi:peroxiredoxin
MEIAALYRGGGTPMGYLIDEQGTIASELAVGARALLELAAVPATTQPEIVAEPTQASRFGNRSLVNSRINRTGLPPGTPAPNFRLPRADGGELMLEMYRGLKVLLVLSDPHCKPCNQLAPKLEKLYRSRPDLRIVLVSRDDLEVNRQKIAEHGLTFPVVLQRHWEISRAYGIFGTPVAYLIDEEGIITSDVAVGNDAILALASSVEDGAPRKEVVPISA